MDRANAWIDGYFARSFTASFREIFISNYRKSYDC